MKRKIFLKMLATSLSILFFCTIIQPVTSIDISQDEEVLPNSNLEEDCNCPEVENSDRPICDYLYEKIIALDLRLVEISELYDQYKDRPIIGQMLEIYMLILLYRVSTLEALWGFFKCEPPE